MGNESYSDSIKRINEEIIIDRSWLIIKKNGEYIIPRLRCPFCLDLVFEPVQCETCKKIYCKYCFNEWKKQSKEKKCLGGTDGHEFKYQQTENWIINYLQNLKIHCIYKNCEEVIEYPNFYNHISKCSNKKKGYKSIERPKNLIFDYNDIPIFIRTIDNINLLFNVKLNTTVKELKKMFQEKISIDYSEIVLNFGGKCMGDSETLESYNIQKNSTIHQTGRLKGGICI